MSRLRAAAGGGAAAERAKLPLVGRKGGSGVLRRRAVFFMERLTDLEFISSVEADVYELPSGRG